MNRSGEPEGLIARQRPEAKEHPCMRLRLRPHISTIPACSSGTRYSEKRKRPRRVYTRIGCLELPERRGGGLKGPEVKKHPRMRLRPHPDISLLPACSPGPRDLEKWKRLRRACRDWVLETPWKAKEGGKWGLKRKSTRACD